MSTGGSGVFAPAGAAPLGSNASAGPVTDPVFILGPSLGLKLPSLTEDETAPLPLGVILWDSR
jgi:hypothetical protein